MVIFVTIVGTGLTVMLGVFVDAGVLLHERRALQDTVDAAARVGTTQVDVSAWLGGTGSAAPLDPAAAEAAAGQFLTGAGLSSYQVTASQGAVTVRASRAARLAFLPLAGVESVTVEATATAQLQLGGP